MKRLTVYNEHNEQETTVYECEICGILNSSSSTMSHHEASHTCRHDGPLVTFLMECDDKHQYYDVIEQVCSICMKTLHVAKLADLEHDNKALEQVFDIITNIGINS